jgi:hypothetical protein
MNKKNHNVLPMWGYMFFQFCDIANVTIIDNKILAKFGYKWEIK